MGIIGNGISAGGKSGIPLEYSTEAEMNSALTKKNKGKAILYTGTSTSTYKQNYLYVCTPDVYTITCDCTNCTASASNPVTIDQDGVATLTFTANEGYLLPYYVSVDGSSGSWNRDTGKLTLRNPTSNVNISISGITTHGQPLTFTANTAGSTISMGYTVWGTIKSVSMQYNVDGVNWNTFTPGSTTITLANSGDKVMFRGDNTGGFNNSALSYYYFVMTGSISASGNIMSLIDNGACTTYAIPGNYCCFYELFGNCSSLTTAPMLPATTLADSCYYRMFYNCTSLIAPPALPSTDASIDSCYKSMFYGCRSLQYVPYLPSRATDAQGDSYSMMFCGCTSLYVSDSKVSGVAECEWCIPGSGTASNSSNNRNMFASCLGTRYSNNCEILNGSWNRYYTQHTPIS